MGPGAQPAHGPGAQPAHGPGAPPAAPVPGAQPRVGPDGVGGTNPALPYPPWAGPDGTGAGRWTAAPPGDPPRRRGTRRPVWIALVLLLALVLAGVATVLMTGRGDDESAGRPARSLSTHSITTETLRVR